MEKSRASYPDDAVSALIAGAFECYRGGDLASAGQATRRALAISGGHPVAWRILAYSSHGTDSVLRAFNRVLAIDPTDADTWADVAATIGTSDIARSRHGLRRALALKPSTAACWRGLGTVDRDLALPCLRRSAVLDPLDLETWRGLARETSGTFAIAFARRGVALAPAVAGSLVDHGLALQGRDGWEAALPAFRRATAADPLSAVAWHNHAAAATSAGNFIEGDRALLRALCLEPSLPPALVLHGNRAIEQAALENARRSYGRAATGGFPEATLNLAMIDLLEGDYVTGWAGFAARWRCRSHRGFRPTDNAAAWNGRPLPGRRLLLRAEPEQALGDTLQFARFIPILAERVGEVVLECESVLIRLLRRTRGVGRAISRGEDPGLVDANCGLMDLGAVFAPTLDALPDLAPHLVVDDPEIQLWRRRLAGTPAPKIGLCWRGNPRFRMDRWRSPGLAALAPVVARGHRHLVSLVLQRRPDEPLPQGMADPMARVADMADTAALVSALDLVITSDTAIAHLAAGLGKPTWVLLHEPADWRWLRRREDSPWYRSVRLFRQPRPGDWAAVAAYVEAALADFLMLTS